MISTRPSTVLLGAFLWCLILAGNTPDAWAGASFQGIGQLPAYNSSQATGVSGDDRVVVGYAKDGSAINVEAFRWSIVEGIVGIGDLPGGEQLPGGAFFSQAHWVSGDGSVIVGVSKSSAGWEAFRWTAASGMIGLGVPPGTDSSSQARAVSADGSIIVGERRSGSAGEAFRWTEATGMVGLGDLPGGLFASQAYGVSSDGSIVVGQGCASTDYFAVRWQDGGIAALPNPPHPYSGSARALDVSDDGATVVGYYSLDDYDIACYWHNGVFHDLLDGGMLGGRAYAASNDGTVIVGHGNNPYAAFIWDETNGLRSLESVLVNEYGMDLSGWQLAEATGISDDKLTIVGTGYHFGLPEAWIATLPEPATLSLLTLGGLALLHRRRGASW